ncbi:ATP-binding protein [Flavobacterium aquidurense]|jgi:signal transduction histidine kinase|uniref:tetratricopeptide repeat-containing sensor histidine kinase n=1 Tax=Flavobacterium aquidurense TaxID=362413 RepID=UPI0009327B1C|nr:tetratricopeptide repeat-containing sensor histidine kinase [Flavobacterium aquidurense]OXA73332.1 ATP-binding protein [Flavobacterium aquidurense]
MKQHIMRFFIFTFLAFLAFVSCQQKSRKNTSKKSTKPEIEKLIIIADRFYDAKKSDSAFYYYNKVKFICNPLTDTENFIGSINRMADIQQSQWDYIGSESTITEAIPYLKHIKNPDLAWNTYVTLSINYLNTYDYKNALLYNKKALELKIKTWQKLASQNNIAVILMEEERYRESLEILLSLIKETEVTSNDQFYAKALDNIGFCYFKTNNLKEAEYYLNESLDIRQRNKWPFDLGKSYLHFAKFHKKSNPALAKRYMLLSYEQFSIINNVDERLSSLKLIIQNSSDKELKKHSILYVNLVDSIFEVKQKAKNQFAKIKYDSKKEKNENLRLKTYKAENELQIEKQKNRNTISYIIIALSLSLITVLYFYLTLRGNKEKIEATYNSETRMAKKLHDELANDIYHTMAFAESRNLALAENRVQLINNLEAIYSRTADISKEKCAIITDKNYVSALREMIAGFGTPNTSITINRLDSVNWQNIEKSNKATIYRVLQELLVNMKKHSNASLVGIHFKTSEKNIIINYTDNGKGIDLNNITFKNGLHNIENRILNIKGEIEIDSVADKGFKVFIKFPA